MARPGSSDYGPLAVAVALYADAASVMTLPPGAFRPPPKVTSSLVELVPRADPLACERTLLERVTAAAFGQRRKMLRQSLKGLPGAIAGLDTLGIDPERRAETLSVAEFVSVARVLSG